MNTKQIDNRTSPTAYAVVHPGMTRYAYGLWPAGFPGQIVGVIVDDGTGTTETPADRQEV